MNRFWLFIFVILQSILVHSQIPSCLNELIAKTGEQNKKNPCDGTDKLSRIEEYSYRDTLLYKLIFVKKLVCLDYASTSVFYTTDCKVRFVIPGGSLLRRQGSTVSAATIGIKFIKNIELDKNADQKNNAGNNTDLAVDEKGKELKKFYLSLNVENLWIAGSHINWETGVADKPDATAGDHTHCSAFVASACKQMGVYILRPPEHGQILLANAQYDWLKTKEAEKKGWMPVTGDSRRSIYVNAQKLANGGKVVVAVIKNPDTKKPGHTALVMPKEADENTLEENGPSLIMAGKHNFNLISLKNGFKSHLTSWPENEILFFVNSQ